MEPLIQPHEGPTAAAASDQELSAVIPAANDLLISSLDVGEQPSTEDADLDAKIAAYRASISSLTAHLGPEAVADAAQLSSSPRGRDQSNVAAAGQSDDAANAMVPGLGREGVDYTVSFGKMHRGGHKTAQLTGRTAQLLCSVFQVAYKQELWLHRHARLPLLCPLRKLARCVDCQLDSAFLTAWSGLADHDTVTPYLASCQAACPAPYPHNAQAYAVPVAPAPLPQVGSADDLDPSEWQVPPHCIPIHANVTTFDWSKLSAVASFDVVMMDPPWQLATANPTRGVALGYSQLTGKQQGGDMLGIDCVVTVSSAKDCTLLYTAFT